MELEKKTSKMDKPKEVKKPAGKITLRYKKNNKYDLHVCRQVFTFKAYETKKVPADVLKDKNWEHEKKYFQIIGG